MIGQVTNDFYKTTKHYCFFQFKVSTDLEEVNYSQDNLSESILKHRIINLIIIYFVVKGDCE